MGWEPMKSLQMEDEEQFEDNHLGGFAAPTRWHHKNPEVFHKKTRSLATLACFFSLPRLSHWSFRVPNFPTYKGWFPVGDPSFFSMLGDPVPWKIHSPRRFQGPNLAGWADVIGCTSCCWCWACGGGKQNRRVMDHGICSWTGVLNTGLVLLGMNLMYMCGKMVAVWSFHFQRSYAYYTSCSYHCWCLMVLAKLPYTVRCGQDVACLREVEDICNKSKGWSVSLVFDAKTCFFSTKDLDPRKNRQKT